MLNATTTAEQIVFLFVGPLNSTRSEHAKLFDQIFLGDVPRQTAHKHLGRVDNGRFVLLGRQFAFPATCGLAYLSRTTILFSGRLNGRVYAASACVHLLMLLHLKAIRWLNK